LRLLAAGLQLRRRSPELFTRGAYLPLQVDGLHGRHVIALARMPGLVCVVPRLVLQLGSEGEWAGSVEVAPEGAGAPRRRGEGADGVAEGGGAGAEGLLCGVSGGAAGGGLATACPEILEPEPDRPTSRAVSGRHCGDPRVGPRRRSLSGAFCYPTSTTSRLA